MVNNIFVYGTLREGERNHWLLKDTNFKGTYETEPEYELRNFGPFPGMMPWGDTSVQGEVYEVSDDLLEDLDYHEGHPSFYNRTKIKLKDYSGEIQAYVISDHPRYQDKLPVIHSGDWKNR